MKAWAAPGIALVLAPHLAGCGGGPQPELADAGPPAHERWCDAERTRACPTWLACNAAPPPAPACVPVDGDPADPGGCHAVACQSLYEACTVGDGGAGACSCAAACQAQCAGNRDDVAENVAEALEAGVACAW